MSLDFYNKNARDPIPALDDRTYIPWSILATNISDKWITTITFEWPLLKHAFIARTENEVWDEEEERTQGKEITGYIKLNSLQQGSKKPVEHLYYTLEYNYTRQTKEGDDNDGMIIIKFARTSVDLYISSLMQILIIDEVSVKEIRNKMLTVEKIDYNSFLTMKYNTLCAIFGKYRQIRVVISWKRGLAYLSRTNTTTRDLHYIVNTGDLAYCHFSLNNMIEYDEKLVCHLRYTNNIEQIDQSWYYEAITIYKHHLYYYLTKTDATPVPGSTM
jgi:hypothetical protein